MSNARCSSSTELRASTKTRRRSALTRGEFRFNRKYKWPSRPAPARHHTRWGTTNNAVRDFRDRSGPFVARDGSHMTATTRTHALRRGKQAAIPARRQSNKSFYINGLRAGGGRSQQRTILRGRFPDIQGRYREFSQFWAFSARMHRRNHPS